MPKLSPESSEILDDYLARLHAALVRMPAEDRDHMVEHVREQVLSMLPMREEPVPPAELSPILKEIGPPLVAAQEILSEHRCSWCNEIRASVEPFDASLKGEPISLRAEGPAHQQKLVRYIAYAERTLTVMFRLLLVELLGGIIVVGLSLAFRDLPALFAGVILLTIAPGATFLAFPFITARGIGSAAQRLSESISSLSARRAILLARLIGLLLLTLGIYALYEFHQHPLW